VAELTDASTAASVVAALGSAAGASGEPTGVVDHGGLSAAQRTVTATLGTLAGSLAGVSGPAVLVTGEVVKHRDKLAWFERRPLFG